MKWVSHQAVTGVLAYAVTSDLLFTAGAIFGAIAPDKIEGKREGLFSIGWRSRHRGWSHWAVLYVAAFFALLQYFNIEDVQGAILNENSPVRLLFAFLFGALCHIAEDALCGKVPTVTPNIKWGVRLFKVGSLREYVIVIVIIIAIYLFKNRTFLSFLFL